MAKLIVYGEDARGFQVYSAYWLNNIIFRN